MSGTCASCARCCCSASTAESLSLTRTGQRLLVGSDRVKDRRASDRRGRDCVRVNVGRERRRERGFIWEGIGVI